MTEKPNPWLLAQTLGVAIGVGRTWPIAGQIRRAEVAWADLGREGDLPPATIIVPARNEERNIVRCVRSLLAQDYPDYELIVVDDGSNDATPGLLAALAAADPRLKIVTLDGELPPGWAGKPHAMQQGYNAARPQSRWILFSDADTFHQPYALRGSVALAEAEQADLLSIIPKFELKSFWEKVLMPFAVLGISLQYPLNQVNRPGSKVAIANGQFLLLRRTAFEGVGGYGGTLRGSLLDDRDMALAIKAAGGRLVLRNGQNLMGVRMYTGLAEFWRGFAKNAFVGSRRPYLAIPFFVATGGWLGVGPFLQLPFALVRWLSSRGSKGGNLLLLSLLQVVLLTLGRRRFDREMGVEWPYAPTEPLAALVFMGIMTDSMFRSLSRRGLAWKGRTYSDAAKTQQLIH